MHLSHRLENVIKSSSVSFERITWRGQIHYSCLSFRLLIVGKESILLVNQNGFFKLLIVNPEHRYAYKCVLVCIPILKIRKKMWWQTYKCCFWEIRLNQGYPTFFIFLFFIFVLISTSLKAQSFDTHFRQFNFFEYRIVH